MNYQPTAWQDEILDGVNVLYDIYQNGELLYGEISIDLNNAVTNAGTPVNAARLNNIESELNFLSDSGCVTTFNTDGSITEAYNNGYTKITTFPDISTILETYLKESQAIYTKTTTFNADGSVKEEVTTL